MNHCALTNFLALLALLLAAPAESREIPADGWEKEVIAEDLEHPWSMAWLDEERMLVTERAGRLRLIHRQEGLRAEPVAGVPEAHVRDQAGLFEVLPDPEFANSGKIWLSLANGDARANTTAVYRARLEGQRLEDVTRVFRAEPERATSVHYGGRMEWLPDGTLLIALGDGFNYREDAQRLDRHTGSIVRIHPDGGIPDDNPFVDEPDARDEIYSYGHRNVQGLVFDRDREILWQHEHGPRGGDEFHRIRPGTNYGWPVVTRGRDYSGARITPFRSHREVELPHASPDSDPLHHWTPAIAPAGMSLYTGDRFDGWQGDLLIAGLVDRAVRRLELDDAGGIVAEHRLFEKLDRRIRDVRSGPEGAVYLLTDHADGELLRMTPAE